LSNYAVSAATVLKVRRLTGTIYKKVKDVGKGKVKGKVVPGFF